MRNGIIGDEMGLGVTGLGSGRVQKAPRKHQTARFRAFLSAYVGPARFNATEAARIAGYADPRRSAYKLRSLWGEEIAKAEAEYRQSLRMQPDEIDERLTDVGRDKKHKDHVNALQTLAKMHGKLNDKIHVTVDRGALGVQLDELIHALIAKRAQQRGEVIDVEAKTVPAQLTDANPDESSKQSR